MFIVSEHELFKTWRSHGGSGAPIFEALPSGRDGCINVNEDEEWPGTKLFGYAEIVNAGCNEVFAPMLCRPVEEFVYGWESLEVVVLRLWDVCF